MPKPKKKTDTPIYMLNDFSQRAKDASFYIESMTVHLQKHQFTNKPHKHDFYLLLYVSNGNGTHSIDFQDYEIKPGSIFLMTPGQVHSWKIDAGIDGYILFFLPEFYNLQVSAGGLLDFKFLNTSGTSAVQLRDRDNAVIKDLADCMHHEFVSDKDADLRVLRCYLQIILFKIERYYKADLTNVAKYSNSEKIRKLQALIDEHFLKKRQPHEYADMMNLSPSYLNSIVKNAVGKTLTDLIAERVVLEAKRLLSYSDLNVSEVALKLGFFDSSYFIRFFKKHERVTPEHFKESINRPI